MPAPNLNAVSTGDVYSDALTVMFPYARTAFSLNVFNAAVMYQVGVLGPAQRDIAWETMEHHLPPSLSTFRDPTQEGFPAGSQYAGIRLRSAVAGSPAIVTVA